MLHPQRIEPQPGQESVWDYPRPPLLEKSLKQIKIIVNQVILVDIAMEYLHCASTRKSFCEWKGFASYYDLTVKDKQVINAGWYYREPTAYFAPIKNYIAFYPSKMDFCYVDEELVKSQPGDFYGGWITHDIVGPFKGDIGSWGW